MGLSSSTPEYSPIIDTKSGPVRGKVFRPLKDKVVDGYLGIPYAESPIGELRFKRPVPVKPWDAPKDCINFGPRSPQVDEFFAQYLNIVGKDEAGCLTLNVIAPRWKSQEFPKGMPVMVWIHGGGFAIHSSSNYGDSTVARNLCVKDILYVSINYRLGALGFFSTGDEHCPGNMGLWDQLLALQWIKENIASFGGDPENITIFGQSAGGASVDLLCLSPHSRDLFRRAIPMSGCAENYFGIRSCKAQKQVGLEFARFIGWTGEDEDTEGLMEWMRKQPISRLEIGISGMNEKKRFVQSEAGFIAFLPNLDGYFFPESIEDLRKQVPRMEIMTGTTEFEGLFFSFVGNLPKSVDGARRFARAMIKEQDYGSSYKEIQEELVQYYMKDINEKDKEKIVEKHVEMFGDVTISNGIIDYSQKMTQLGHTVYMYSFDHFNLNGFGFLKWVMPFKGATHCTELRYILGKGVISKFKPNDDDCDMLEIMTTFFSNFAKYGNPNGKGKDQFWEKQSIDHPFRYFKINLPYGKMADNYQDQRALFWNEKILTRKMTDLQETKGKM